MKKTVLPDFIGAKIVSIIHSIFPHIADNPELVGPIDLIIIQRGY